MDSDVSYSSPHALIVNVSGLFGIVIFLQQMWSGISLNHVLLTSVVSGLVAYLTLMIGYAAARRIITQAPSSPPADDSSEPSPDSTDAEAETDETQSASKPQMA
ncbi:MAG: hypothetical protein ABEL51_07855 [Salinibacter sp.]